MSTGPAGVRRTLFLGFLSSRAAPPTASPGGGFRGGHPTREKHNTNRHPAPARPVDMDISRARGWVHTPSYLPFGRETNIRIFVLKSMLRVSCGNLIFVKGVSNYFRHGAESDSEKTNQCRVSVESDRVSVVTDPGGRKPDQIHRIRSDSKLPIFP